MDINAIVATAITGLLSTLCGGGIVWKLMTRWMNQVESNFTKVFSWLEKIAESFVTIADCEKCEQRLTEKRKERDRQIISLEDRVHEVGVNAGELWGVILAKFPEIERRHGTREAKENVR